MLLPHSTTWAPEHDLQTAIPSTTKITERFPHNRNGTIVSIDFQWPTPPLLYTSPQIRREVMGLYYSSSVFQFFPIGVFMRFGRYTPINFGALTDKLHLIRRFQINSRGLIVTINLSKTDRRERVTVQDDSHGLRARVRSSKRFAVQKSSPSRLEMIRGLFEHVIAPIGRSGGLQRKDFVRVLQVLD